MTQQILAGEAAAFEQLLDAYRAAYKQGGLADVFELQRRLDAELKQVVVQPEDASSELAWRLIAARQLSDVLIPKYTAAMTAYAAANPA